MYDNGHIFGTIHQIDKQNESMLSKISQHRNSCLGAKTTRCEGRHMYLAKDGLHKHSMNCIKTHEKKEENVRKMQHQIERNGIWSTYHRIVNIISKHKHVGFDEQNTNQNLFTVHKHESRQENSLPAYPNPTQRVNYGSEAFHGRLTREVLVAKTNQCRVFLVRYMRAQVSNRAFSASHGSCCTRRAPRKVCAKTIYKL